MILWAHRYPQWGWLLPMLFGAAGAGVAIPVLGVFTGVPGVACNRALLTTLDLYARWGDRLSRLGRWPAQLSGGLVGATIGLLGWFTPTAVGSGHVLAEEVLDGRIGLAAIPRRQGLHETVPTANTRLEAGDRLTVVVAPQASAAIPLLREGCASAHSPHRSATSSTPPDTASMTS
jgi:hypothetical protein